MIFAQYPETTTWQAYDRSDCIHRGITDWGLRKGTSTFPTSATDGTLDRPMTPTADTSLFRAENARLHCGPISLCYFVLVMVQMSACMYDLPCRTQLRCSTLAFLTAYSNAEAGPQHSRREGHCIFTMTLTAFLGGASPQKPAADDTGKVDNNVEGGTQEVVLSLGARPHGLYRCHGC